MKLSKLLYLTVFSSALSFAQVGINTTTPDASSALDIRSGTIPMGMLTPRVTTTERLLIGTRPSPLAADGLIVYDTDLKSLYHWSNPANVWMKVNTGTQVAGRTNFKRIQSEADLIASSTVVAGNYQLITNTYYEINGTIPLTKPIDLNKAYVAGVDADEDVLLFPGGTIFKGNTGGSIKNVTLKGGRAFEITGPGIASNSSLLIQNTIIDGMSISVGNITGLGLIYSGVVQYINNANGITYSNIGNCLLDNQAWLNTNNGTFETFIGNFGLLEKGSGFSNVNGSDLAFDVSGVTLNVGTGILTGTVFTGTTTNVAGYVKGYTTGSYPGYNFSNAWSVDSPGIPREGDAEATGDINLEAAVGSGALTSFVGTGSSSRKKLSGTTSSNNLFRFTKDGDNKIVYTGNKTRYFQVSASVSYQGTDDLTVILYIAKNGIVIEQTKVYGRGATGFFTNAGILALPIIGTVQLKKTDYIEIWAERLAGAGNMQTVSLNLTAR